jgi:hypothetical protein
MIRVWQGTNELLLHGTRMNRHRIGILCQIAGAMIAISGLVTAVGRLHLLRNAKEASQLDPIYFPPKLIQSAIIALAGFIAAYILIRVGSHLKSKRQTVLAAGNKEQQTNP